MKIPENAEKIIHILNDSGYEAYIVGGCVRDSLMGKNPKDWDITTSALPRQVIFLFDKVIETGIQHGTVTILMGKENYEVTTYRIDGEYKDYRRPSSVAFTKNLEEDLRRRDFTMNAIAYHPKTGYFDPFDGIKDIKKGLIKGVGNADLRFKEDALRMMRAIRFASQTGFKIEEKTFLALLDNVILIKQISVERIRDEFLKALNQDYMENCLLFNVCHIFLFINREIYHYLNQYLDIKIKIIKNCRKDVNLRLAVLFHAMEENLLKNSLTLMKLDNKSIKYIVLLCRYLNSSFTAHAYDIRKLAGTIGTETVSEILYLKDLFGENTINHQNCLNKIIAQQDPITLRDLAIDGNELMEIGICKGKAIGETLAYLLDCVWLEPNLNNRAKLLMLAQCRNKN